MKKNKKRADVPIKVPPYSAEEILSFLMGNGILDMDDVKNDMMISQKSKILEKYKDNIKKLNGKTDRRYYIRVKDPSKKDGRRTLKANTEKELLDKIYQWHMENYVELNEEIEKDKITLSDLYPEFLEYKKMTTWSESTCTRNLSVWDNYYADADIINKPIRKIKLKDLEEWAYSLIKERRLTKKEFDNVATWMKQMMEYAEQEEIIDKNYYRLLKIKNMNIFRETKGRSDENMVLAPDSEVMLYEECLKLFWKNHYPVNRMIPLAVILLFQIGCRPCEVCAIRFSDIKGDEIVISRLYSEKEDSVKEEHTKAGHGSRPIILTPLAMEIISMIKAQRGEINGADYILVDNDDDLKGFYNRLRKTFPLICERLGIPHNTLYSGRRTFISSLIDENVNIKTIQNYVGHNDSKTTLNNYCFDRSDKEKRAEQLKNARLSVCLKDLVPTVPK